MIGEMTMTIDSFGTVSTPAAPAMPSAASTLAAPEQWFLNFATGNPNGDSGPAVNEFTAFNYLAVYQCVGLIAGKIAELSLETYREDGGSRTPATDRYERGLLLHEFNPNMSAMTARETGMAHLLTWGNQYTQIVWNKSGSTVLSLVPLGPDVTKPYKGDNGELLYDVFRRGTGEKLITLDASEVLHVPGLGFDGLVGYSPIRIAKTSIRAGMVQDREAEDFAVNGIRPPGAIGFPAGSKFRDEQEAIQYRERFNKIHAAPGSARRVLILEDGATWQQIGIDPKSAQLLDSRKYSRKDICGIYRVPPFLIGDIESSTSWGTGIGQQMQAFVDYCLLTWMRRIEVEYKRKLARGADDIYYRHCVEEMLRGDFEGRTKSFQILHQRGIITDNEWRRGEHFNPLEGGDVRHIPLNEVLVDADGDPVNLSPAASGPTAPEAPAEEPPPTDTPAGDEAKPDMETATAAAGSGDIQSTALNGAQITSLLLLTDKVASGNYTAAAGEAILQASFPLMDRGLIKTMIEELSTNAPEAPPTEEEIETPAKQEAEPSPPEPEEPVNDQGQNAKLAGLLRRVIVSAAGRCLRREAAEVRKAVARVDRNFIAWVDEFYAKQAPIVVDAVGPLVEAWSAAFGGPTDYSEQHVAQSRRELLAAADGDPVGFADRVERVVAHWEAERLVEVAGEFHPPGEAVIDRTAFFRP